jgi:hypothetical protein
LVAADDGGLRIAGSHDGGGKDGAVEGETAAAAKDGHTVEYLKQWAMLDIRGWWYAANFNCHLALWARVDRARVVGRLDVSRFMTPS